MRRSRVYTSLLTLIAVHAMASHGHAQRVEFPTPTNTFPPPAVTYPSTPFPATQPLGTYPPSTPVPPPVQAEAMQNLVGDVQRFGMPFDPYAQPAQYVAPAPPPPPPPAVPYTTPAPAAAPWLTLPTLSPSWGGLYAGFEGTILEPRVGSVVFPASSITLDGVPLPIESFTFEPDYDFELSPRVWVGYKGVAGFGIRGRWWYFDHSGAGNFDIEDLPEGAMVDLDGDMLLDDSLALSLHSDLRMNVIDLEGTQDGQFHNWDFQVSGGVRYAKIDYDLIGTITGSIDPPPAPPEFTHTLSALSEFEGFGPTIGVSGRRPFVAFDGLAFLVNVRLAFLFGDSEASFGDPDMITSLPDGVVFEDSVQAWEAQIGFEYSRQLASGARLFGGAFLEGQVWEWGFPTGITGDDLGFVGPTFTVGLAR